MKRTKPNKVAASAFEAYKFAYNLFDACGFKNAGYGIFGYQVKKALLRNYKKMLYF